MKNKVFKTIYLSLMLTLLVSVNTFASEKTYEQLLAEYNQAMIKYEEDLKQNEINKQINEQLKAQYEQEKAQYDVEYQQYLVELEEFNQQMAIAEENKNQDGYLSEVISQSLQFTDEPNATLTVQGGEQTDVIAPPEARYTIYPGGGGAYQPNVGRLISKGQTVTATYTNLQNSFYCGKKIAKVVYTFNLNENNASDQCILFMYNNPTSGYYIGNYSKAILPTSLQIKHQFFYEDGTPVNFSKENPAVLSVSSLNRYDSSDVVETVYNHNFRFVKITGSYATQHANGAIYSDVNTEPPHLPDGWDSIDSPDFYKASGAGVIESGNSVVYSIYNPAGGQWTAFNNKIPKPAILPVKPVPPTPPVEPTYLAIVEPIKPIAPKQEQVVAPDNKVIKTSGSSNAIMYLGLIMISALMVLVLRRWK